MAHFLTCSSVKTGTLTCCALASPPPYFFWVPSPGHSRNSIFWLSSYNQVKELAFRVSKRNVEKRLKKWWNLDLRCNRLYA